MSYYYLGGRLVAMSQNSTLSYIHQDHLTGTSLMTDAYGDQLDTTMKYYPFGACRNSQPEIDSFPTDKLFTGQMLDGAYLKNIGMPIYSLIRGR